MSEHGTTKLHQDANNIAVQGTLCPIPDKNELVSISGITARNSTAFTYKVIRVISSVACFFKLGDSTVTADTGDHYLPQNVVEYFTVKDYTHIAVITSGAVGNFLISEMG